MYEADVRVRADAGFDIATHASVIRKCYVGYVRLYVAVNSCKNSVCLKAAS